MHIGSCWGDLRERELLEDLGEDGRIFFRMDPQVIAWGDIDWIAVAQDKDRWPINVVMNLRVP